MTKPVDETNSKKVPRRDILNTWAQIIGIVIAGIWGGYEFFYKEVHLKNIAPANITINVDLKVTGEKELQLSKDQRKYLSIIADVKASNKTDKKLYFSKNSFVLHGYAISRISESEKEFSKRFKSKLPPEHGHDFYMSKDITTEDEIISEGVIFNEEFIEPNESLQRKAVLFVEKGKFDYLEIKVNLDSVKIQKNSNSKTEGFISRTQLPLWQLSQN